MRRRRFRFWPGTPAPVSLPGPATVWIVEVMSLPAEGRDWQQYELEELQERFGEDSEEYLEAAGPVDGYRAHYAYGPYSQVQAERLAEWLNRPEVAEREGIGGASPYPLNRYVPSGRYMREGK